MTVKKTLLGIGVISVFSFVGYKLYKSLKLKPADKPNWDDFEDETDWDDFEDETDWDDFEDETDWDSIEDELDDFESCMNKPIDGVDSCENEAKKGLFSDDDLMTPLCDREGYEDDEFQIVCGCSRFDAINEIRDRAEKDGYTMGKLMTMPNDELCSLYASYIV